LPGVVGESYALAVAERLELPQPVLDRANELLDSETRQLGDLIRDMEDQKGLIDQQVAEIEEKKKEIAVLEIKMKEEQKKMEKKMPTARRNEARKFAKKLEEKEQILEDVLDKLKSDPSKKLIAKSWEDIKFVKRDAINEAENIPSVMKTKQKAAKAVEEAKQELVPLAEIRDRPMLEPGDQLTVCKSGGLFGREATVVKDLGKQVQVQVSGLSMTMKNTEFSMVTTIDVVPGTVKLAVPTTSNNNKKNGDGKSSRLSKSAELSLQAESKSVGSSSYSDDSNNQSNRKSLSIRMDHASNTIDVRGCNLEDAKDKVKGKISECIMNGYSSVYILHGHDGSGGVLKSKLRNWLKSDKQKGIQTSWAPADSADGGDAFTKLELS
jgi:DNA mismatch repair protein MutS2